MNRRNMLRNSLLAIPALSLKSQYLKGFGLSANPSFAQEGPFKPEWASLEQYQTPDWFRNAKFGIWAHWGPQCQPEHGDWYARGMYQEGSDHYNYHLKKYGHPSVFGFKDVIHEWKAEAWDPEALLSVYKAAGAKYFVALANHHDNFDNYESSFQPWNATKMGPKKDLIKGWAAAAKAHGLHFGVSVHAAHAWTWYEVAQHSDSKGPMKGIPYDGNLTKANGGGKWWKSDDPQELYAQRHPESKSGDVWDWGKNAAPPSEAYCTKFYNRTIELIDKYEPDLLYFDDTILPLYPVSDVGLRIAAHMYNRNIAKHGSLQAVLTGKILNEQQRKCLVWDIERGQSNQIEPFCWQTDTCIGGWHYDQRILDKHGYKSARTVIHTLVDVVSKNGNLLLSIPVKGNGTIDSDEKEVLKGITGWMRVNSESIYDTRPWTVFGEGPAMQGAAALSAQGFNEGKGKPFTAEDIRFAQKGNDLYATTLGVPTSEVLIRSLAGKPAAGVRLLGYDQPLQWSRSDNGLLIKMPDNFAGELAAVFEIKGVGSK